MGLKCLLLIAWLTATTAASWLKSHDGGNRCQWTYTANDTIDAVAIWDDTLYVSSWDNIYALSRSDASVLRHFKVESPVESLALGLRGQMLAARLEKGIYVANTTSWPWVFSAPDDVVAIAWSPSGEVAYALSKAIVYALDASSGTELWHSEERVIHYYASDIKLMSSEKLLFVTMAYGRMVALDVSDGRQVWNYSVPEDVVGYRHLTSVPSPRGDEVYLTWGDDRYQVLNMSDGQPLRSFRLESGTRLAIDPSGSLLFILSESGASAFNLSSGKAVWGDVIDDSDDLSRSPYDLTLSPAGDIVYVASLNTALYALDAATGAKLWRRRASTDDYFGDPSIAAGLSGLYMVADDWGSVSQYDVTREGQELCNFSLGTQSTNWDTKFIAASPLGNSVLVASGGKVRLVNANCGRDRLIYMGASDILALAVDETRGTLYAASQDKEYAVRPSDDDHAQIASMGGLRVYSHALSPKADVLFAGYEAGIYALNVSRRAWSYKNGSDWSPATEAPNKYGTLMAVSPSGDIIYVGSSTEVSAFSVFTGQRLWNYTWGIQTGGWTNNVALSPSGHTLFVGSAAPSVCALDAFDGSVLWEREVASSHKRVLVSPSGQVVFSENTRVHAVEPVEGAELWDFSTAWDVTALGMSRSGGIVVAGTIAGYNTGATIYVIDASNGTQVWNFTTGNKDRARRRKLPPGDMSAPPGSVYTVAVSPSGDLVLAGVGNRTCAFDAVSGKLEWVFTTGGWVDSLVVSLSGRIVFVGSGDHHVYAVHATTGHEVWRFRTEGVVRSVILSLSGDLLFVGSCDQRVYALNASSGAMLMNFFTGDYIYSLIASPAGGLFASSMGGNVSAFNVPLWVFPTKDRVVSEAIHPSGQVVFTGSLDHWVYALDTTGGKQLWAMDMHSDVTALAVSAIRGDKLYTATGDGTLHVLRCSDGYRLWSYGLGTVVNGLAVGRSGELYAAMNNHSVMALSTEELMEVPELDWVSRKGPNSYCNHAIRLSPRRTMARY